MGKCSPSLIKRKKNQACEIKLENSAQVVENSLICNLMCQTSLLFTHINLLYVLPLFINYCENFQYHAAAQLNYEQRVDEESPVLSRPI